MKRGSINKTLSFICAFVMVFSLALTNVSHAYADDSNPPMLESFSINKDSDNQDKSYLFDKASKKAATIAFEVDHVEPEYYGKIVEDFSGKKMIGVLRVYIKNPVVCQSGTITETPANFPTDTSSKVYIPSKSFSGVTNKEGAAVATNTVPTGTWVADSGFYKCTNATGSIKITDSDNAVYYYYFIAIPMGLNSAPVIIADPNPAEYMIGVGTEWSLNLESVFNDPDNDSLTYKVKINDGEYTATETIFRYSSNNAETITISFIANDGEKDSEPYTVILNYGYNIINTSIQGEYYFNGPTNQSMGSISVTVNGNEDNKARPGDSVVINAVPSKFIGWSGDVYSSKVDDWVLDGLQDSETQENGNSISFEMPDNPVSVQAVFTKDGSLVNLSANAFDGGDLQLVINGMSSYEDLTFNYDSNQHERDVIVDTVIANAEVSVIVWPEASYNPNYTVKEWEINNLTTGASVDVRYELNQYPSSNDQYQRPYFTVDGTSSYSIKAIFEAKDYGDVKVSVNNDAMGTAVAKVGSVAASTNLYGVVLGQTVELSATATEGYQFKAWAASYGSDPAVEIDITNADQPNASFVMPATNHADVNVTATFEKDPSYVSHECMLEDVELTGGGNTYTAEQDGTEFVITLPAGTDVSSLAEWTLQYTVSEGASVTKGGQDFPSGSACGMQLNTLTDLIVIAADGETTKTYTVVIKLEGFVNVNPSYSASITMSENFNLNLYIKDIQPADASKFTVKWTFDGKDFEQNLGELSTQSDGRYKLVLARVYSYQMTRQFNISIYYQAEGAAEASKLRTINVSIQMLLEYLYNNPVNNATDELMKSIYAAALDYGASAQLYFHGRTYAGGVYDCDVENLANKNTNPSNTITATKPANTPSREGSITGLEIKSASLILESETSIKIAFTYSGDISGLNISCDNGKEVTDPVLGSDGRYSIKIEGIRSYQLYKDYTITFQAGSETVTLIYSPYAYAVTMWNSEAKLSRLVQSLVAFGDVAKQRW